jgi:ABC-type branched-subunit amino acid transport system substrate-binding protein
MIKTIITLLMISNCAFAKDINIAIASMMKNLENESSIIFGDHVRKGIYLSLTHNKAKLKKKNIRVFLKEYNYTSETKSILSTAKQINESNVIAVHGYDYSSHAVLASHVHKKTKLAIALPTATATKIKALSTNYFQIAGSNDSQANAIYKLLLKKRSKNITIIKRMNCEYCKDLADEVEKISIRNKITVQMINANTIAEIKESVKNNILILPMYESEAINFIEYFSKKRNGLTYIGGDGWTSKGKRYFSTLKNLDFKAVCLAHWDFQLNTKVANKFKSDYLSNFGTNATDISALSYDAMNFLLQGVLKDKKLTRESLLEILDSTDTYTGVTGTLQKQDKHFAKSGFIYLNWINKDFKILK